MTHSNPDHPAAPPASPLPNSSFRPLFLPSWAVALALTGLLAAAAWKIWGDDLELNRRGRFEIAENRAAEIGGPPVQTLYDRYQMEPPPNSEAFGKAINRALSALAREPCDRRAVMTAENELKRGGFVRDSAKLLLGYARTCPDSNRALAEAAEIYFMLGDLPPAHEAIERAIRADPGWASAHVLLAKILQRLRRSEEALDAYAAGIRLIGDLKAVPAEIFTSMSGLYAALGRHCEAMTPIQTYIAADPGERDTPVLRYLIAEQARQGDCDHTYVEGATKLRRASKDVILARAQINGVSGLFAIDTGASFVAVSKTFADKAKLAALQTGKVGMQTANGVAAASLATIAKIRLGAARADAVPAVIMDKPPGRGVDGLLGMSFLARFDIVLTDQELTLVAKPAQTKSLQ
jgi:clan AA aspartic protease (TIGR02281 family)